MNEWREQLRSVVASWSLSPEEQLGIVEELEQHLEQELAELTPRIGADAAGKHIMDQVNDPALRNAFVRPRHEPAASVQHSRERGHAWWAFMRDLRYGFRSLRASPGTTIMASVALGLGIGLTTVMFTVIYSLLLRGLPFEKADNIAMVMEANPSDGEEELQLSTQDYFALRGAQQSFEVFGAWAPATVNIADNERPERVLAARMTAGALNLTHVQPLLGRSLREGDEATGGELVVVLSHKLWRDRYSGDSTAVGHVLRVNGQPATIVGVMPEGFGFPRDPKIWLPLRLDAALLPWGTGTYVNGIARLRDGETYQRASAELARVSARIAADHPQSNKGVITVVQPFIRASIPLRVNALLYTMFAAVSLVFLVACANVANLLVARAMHRSKEVALRVALGASRLAIARQFLAEALLLSLVAGGIGALLAQGGLAVFRDVTANEMPFWADNRLHPQIFLFIAFAAVIASLVSGLLPAINAARSDINDVLKDQSMGSSSLRAGRLSRGLVIFELALSTALLVVAALTTKSVVNIRSVQPGFRTSGVMTGTITLSVRDTVRRAAFLDQLQSKIAELPGVTATSLSSNVPGPGWSGERIAVEGKTYASARDYPVIRQLAVTPGFFKTFDVSVSSGRPISSEDRSGTMRVAVVNQRFAEKQFPGANAIGHRIKLNPSDSNSTWATIVGVIPNLFATDQGSINNGNPWPSEVITAYLQETRSTASIAIRTNGDPLGLAQPLRAVVASLDPDLPVYWLSPMTELLSKSRWDVRVFGGLFVVFGIVALTLASIGLYAVIAFSVCRREREMGIRMALGAAALDVIKIVFRSTAILLAVGVSIGVALGIGGARLAGAVMFEVKPNDPATVAIVVGILLATGAAACAVPAMRATKSDPVRSLRAE